MHADVVLPSNSDPVLAVTLTILAALALGLLVWRRRRRSGN
ncbi:MAG: hypothetical protein RIT25_2114 [Planctomycetota bacterium]|jgi:MYXO-CTERM domain-containing protein